MSGVLTWFLTTVAPACGPYLAPTILDNADQYLRTMPEADFRTEIQALLPAVEERDRCALERRTGPWTRTPAWLVTANADVSDLAAALNAQAVPRSLVQQRLASYRAFRLSLGGWESRLVHWTGAAAPLPVPSGESVGPPAGIPLEFAYYARGALAYALGNVPLARAWWLAVLQLAPDQRHYKSVWAAYMLGRTQGGSPAAAKGWYQRVRWMTAHGYADSLDLATASLGWEAREELLGHRFERAAALYMAQYRRGEGGALVSLQILARQALAAGEPRLQTASRDPLLRRILTAYLVSREAPWNEAVPAEVATRWLATLERETPTPVEGADRMGWLAYRGGDFDAAARWLALAPEDSITARWLRAKLCLRSGDLAAGQAGLEAVVHSLDRVKESDRRGDGPSFAATEQADGRSPGSQAAGELAALLMSDGRYGDALSLLVRYGWWTDASYVAERVLSVDELRDRVEREWPDQPPDRGTNESWWCNAYIATADDATRAIRCLLARRLAREGRWRESAGYYPWQWRPWIADYGGCLEKGRDPRRTTTERAASLWRAARLMRYAGMELFGTEVDPDWSEYAGEYELTAWSETRGGTNGPVLAPVRADERRRIRRHTVVPEARFHYRYVAADLAWEAARLMPDESPITAQVLCQAGSWLKFRDPKAANRFYRALVRRCGSTDVGKAADRLRWFPPCESVFVRLR